MASVPAEIDAVLVAKVSQKLRDIKVKVLQNPDTLGKPGGVPELFRAAQHVRDAEFNRLEGVTVLRVSRASLASGGRVGGAASDATPAAASSDAAANSESAEIEVIQID